MAKKSAIVLHHSLTKDGTTVSWGAIRKFHTETNGWRAIGYHFGIELVGDTYEILVGRMVEEEAAACKEGSMNRLGIHICLVGNFDEGPVPEAQWKAAVRLVASLMQQFQIPVGRIWGHRDFANKTCPGVRFDLEAFRRDVGRLVLGRETAA